MQFHLTHYAQDIYFGAGAVARLPEAVEAAGWRRVLLVTSGSARRAGRAGQVEGLLGARCMGVYDRAQPHVPAGQVDEAAALARGAQAEAVLALGGGSPIGLAKAVGAALGVPVAAIPTTYAGSEMTPVYGVTRDEAGTPRKVTANDPRITPRVVIYDPDLTLDLPPGLTATTGINALAHCVEAVYSVTANPLSTAAALDGAARIARALPRCVADGADRAARAEMLAGAHLAGTALARVAMALHHGLCHVLGGSAGVPHGVANSIILPHAMRFNQDSAAHELAVLAYALGAAPPGAPPPEAARAAVAAVDALIAKLGVPRRLREAGVAESDLPRLAQLAPLSRAVQQNPRPVSAADAEAILRAAW